MWGLNLSGLSQFCRNPHYDASGTSHAYSLAGIAAASAIGRRLHGKTEPLWKQFIDLPAKVRPRRLVNEIMGLAAELKETNTYIAPFVTGLAQTLPQRAGSSDDFFSESEIYACCAASLLEYVDEAPEVDAAIRSIAQDFVAASQTAFAGVYDSLVANDHSLLSSTGGLGDLFYLPIRISKLLGWIGGSIIVARLLDPPGTPDSPLAMRLAEKVLEAYGSSVVAVSDVQAPYTLLAARGLTMLDRLDLVEAVFSRLFHDFIVRRGRVARAHLELDKALEFLLARLSSEFSDSHEIIATPTELLPVLLTVGHNLQLADSIDPYLREIDHLALNVYIPDDHRQFAQESMRDGTNLTFQIGSEFGLGVFSVEDFMKGFGEYCSPRITRDERRENRYVQITCVLSSLLFPDRVPWLIL